MPLRRAATGHKASAANTSTLAAKRQQFKCWLEAISSASMITIWILFAYLVAANPRQTQSAQDDAPAAGQPGRSKAPGDRQTSPERSNLLRSEPAASASESGPPSGWEIRGDAAWGSLGDPAAEYSGQGLRFLSGKDLDQDGKQEGVASLTLRGAASKEQRWFRVRIRALAQDDFRVALDDLYLRIDFFRDGGTNPLDHVKQSLYELVERDRRALADNGTNKKLGGATWRWFDMTFRTPFPEVDSLRLSVGFGHGQGKEIRGEFWVSEAELTAIEAPADYMPPKPPPPGRAKTEKERFVPLGGRWYFDPRGGERTAPAEFSYRNAEQLLYLSDRFEAPFADNMSAWLRKGYLDSSGDVVKQDRFITENVVVSFTSTHLLIRSHNLPNHPTAVFPDRLRGLDGNPNYIQERVTTHRIPLEPKVNANHVAMKNANNNDHALPMGPIGVAVNGVVFFNPFDHLLDEDAVWRLDRCCGHPSPRSQYHYHKYPACVKTPWSDDGAGHSPLIGFANDGFPVYGPYESTGLLAKDDSSRPLNEFNLHEDPERGPHYHVTPGKFPHIIGGFWGVVEARQPSGDRPPGAGGKKGAGKRPPPPGKQRP